MYIKPEGDWGLGIGIGDWRISAVGPSGLHVY